jgi:hypothetical protein
LIYNGRRSIAATDKLMTLNRKMLGLAAASCVFFTVDSHAHHSFAANFYFDQVTEIEGEVVAVRWRNPHVEFDVEGIDDDGLQHRWTAETYALSGLRARDIVSPFVAVGDHVRVAGNPGRRKTDNLYVTNLLMANGDEVVLRDAGGFRFTDQVHDASGSQYVEAGDGSRPELGIFRVWTTPVISPFPFPEDVNPSLTRTRLPLTPGALAVLEAFDPIDDNPINDCALKGMPVIMEQPYPLQFYEEDGNIIIHLEEYDTFRTVYMGANATTVEPVPGILGHSVGRWDGNTLIVETTSMNWGWFDTVGVPLSTNARAVERWTVADDGSRLDWEMVVTDPATFTEPVTLTKFFFYVPGNQVNRYECTVGTG